MKTQDEELEESKVLLSEFGTRHFVASEGNKIRVFEKTFDEYGNSKLNNYSTRDFFDLYAHIQIAVPARSRKAKIEYFNIAEY